VFAWWVLAFRFLAIVASLQVSGAPHLLGDAVELVTVGHHPDESPPHEDDPNHECPPGCPTCHHVHAGSLSLPVQVPTPTSFVPRVINPRIVVIAYDGDAPDGPDPISIYRPPRPDRSVA
jgi:hypothetical protein